MNTDAANLKTSESRPDPPLVRFDMFYLRHSFTSFDDFAKAVELLRSFSFEPRSNKRESFKFVFPIGPDALYEGLEMDSKGKMSNDRRFVARSGELLYVMLTRAKRGAELGDLLANRLLDCKAPMNRLARAKQGKPQRADAKSRSWAWQRARRYPPALQGRRWRSCAWT